MLLTQLIDQQQNTYAQIQAQIEALQEQQRQIQAYLQRLGSVESQMVSAAQVMQEAIASINEVCPDELANYKNLISGLFNKLTAVLPAHDDDDDPDPTPPTTPDTQPIPDEDKTTEVVASTTPDTQPIPDEDKTTEVVASTTPDTQPIPNEDKTTEVVAVVVEAVPISEYKTLTQEISLYVDSMSYAEIRSELARARLNNKGNHTTLKTRLIEHYKGLDVTELRLIASSLNTRSLAA